MTEDDLTQAELFDVFSNARRRRTVRYLKRRGGKVDLAPMVEHVAAWENDVDPDAVTRAQRRRVYISLYQTHLPMLADHGIVEWDPEEHTIELLADPARFDPYLDSHEGGDRRWHAVYASLALAGACAFALAWLAVGPLTPAFAPLVALALAVGTFAVAVLHRSRRAGSIRPASILGR